MDASIPAHLVDEFTFWSDDEASAVEASCVADDDDKELVFGGPAAGEHFVVCVVFILGHIVGVPSHRTEDYFGTERAQATDSLGDFAVETNHCTGAKLSAVEF